MDSVVETILNRKNNGNGKLVFCHYKDEIDALVQRLLDGGIERVVSLDGRDSMIARAELLSQAYDVLVLQIQTGCEGLNLQENYSEIYFVTPHWNPSVEDQAIGRCHRIGQKKPVSVFRFQMAPPLQKEDTCVSFDNYVTFVQDKKREIVSGILP
jgi:SNF2 family DNA or RNA helicase